MEGGEGGRKVSISDVVIGRKRYFQHSKNQIDEEGEAKKKTGAILLQTAFGSRLGARVAEIWRERHTCHPNEIILQGC